MIWQQVVLLKNFSNVIKIKSRMDQTMQKINKQAGFTLIELIMVIVILGVLAAFALPRFADLGTDARKSSIQALGGAIKAAANIAHSKQLATGAADDAPVDLDGATGAGKNVTMVSGYPTANAAGIGRAAQIIETDYASTETADDTGGPVVYSLQDGCTVTYSSLNASVVIDDESC
jgi:MSHA pilin protein MshA